MFNSVVIGKSRNIFKNLFSFKGRADGLDYLLFIASFNLIYGLINTLLIFLTNNNYITTNMNISCSKVLTILMSFLTYFMMSKRFHDFSRSGWNVWLYIISIIIIQICCAVTQAGIYVAFALLQIIGLMFTFFFIVKPGHKVDNQYGPYKERDRYTNLDYVVIFICIGLFVYTHFYQLFYISIPTLINFYS